MLVTVKIMEIRKITLINLEYNWYNGLNFELLSIEVGCFDGTLLGFELSERFLNIHLLFFYLEVKRPC